MARKKRFYRINSCHHVMLRGNGGQDLFLDDADRSRFCLLLQAAAEKYSFRVHSFCFMKNHVHLMLEPTERPLQDGVHSFSFRYAQYLTQNIIKEATSIRAGSFLFLSKMAPTSNA